MSDLNAILPSDFYSNPNNTLTGGMPSSSLLQNDLDGNFTSLPSGSSATSLGDYSSILSNIGAGLTGANAGTGVSTSTGTGSTGTTSGNSSGLTTFTSDSLIGRVLFFLLGLVFMAGAIYSYKR